MKTFIQPIYILTRSILIVILISVAGLHPAFSNPTIEKDPVEEKDQSIMLALLLDTSNSMDGLIEQAKSQLWRIVNELASAKCGDGSKPSIKIALYEYGNDGLPASEGYIRQVSGLTDDLDVISEKLFALRTNGGNEFCGHVIRTSLRQLAWSVSRADLKMIFIAGNEPFTQGEVSYRIACELAKEKDVIVNTIFCGDYEEGIRTDWKRGSEITGGTFMSIQQDRRTVYVSTPYDERIEALNDQLNDTYIYYGSHGRSKKSLQSAQDENAEQYGKENKVERAVSKSSHAYKNSTWDLVDAAKENDQVIAETEAANLPSEMKDMSTTERKAYVLKKSEERTRVQKEIQKLNESRRQYIAAHSTDEQKASSLDAVMLKAVREHAKAKNFDL